MIYNSTLQTFDGSRLSELFLLIYRKVCNCSTHCLQAVLYLRNVNIYFLKGIEVTDNKYLHTSFKNNTDYSLFLKYTRNINSVLFPSVRFTLTRTPFNWEKTTDFSGLDDQSTNLIHFTPGQGRQDLIHVEKEIEIYRDRARGKGRAFPPNPSPL